MIDLRSDTVTRPTPAMREAMAHAEVGDDVFGDDPTLIALQARAAELFGHEAALFAPSGTMANQIALQMTVSPGEEVVCDSDAHIVTYEMGAAAAYGGISSRTWTAAGAQVDPELVGSMIRGFGGYQVGTRSVAVELTHNMSGGTIIPLSTLERLRELTRERGVLLHCDGARIWNASVASGVSLHGYGQLFDTLSVCLSKGLGAPVGSLVLGSAEKIEKARWIRKRLGGGMRQAGILAAAGLYALEHHIDRLAEDHARARRLAAALGAPEPETNLILLAHPDPAGVVAAARDEGVLIAAVGPRTIRLITHLDLDDAAVERAAEVLGKLLV